MIPIRRSWHEGGRNRYDWGRIYQNWKLKVKLFGHVLAIIPCKLSSMYSVIGFRDIHMYVDSPGVFTTMSIIK